VSAKPEHVVFMQTIEPSESGIPRGHRLRWRRTTGTYLALVVVGQTDPLPHCWRSALLLNRSARRQSSAEQIALS
jgi:hypothetical protein